MTCKFCKEEKKLIKAHIIPEGFFRRLRDSGVAPILATNKKGEYKKRVPIGVYDQEILCGDCESIWGGWDTYAQEFLGEIPLGGQPIYARGQYIGYQVDTYDYAKLKLFFVAVLWRASASQHPYYARIALGPFEDKAKAMLSRGDPGSRENFAVTLAKFDDPLGIGMLDPHPEKLDGVNYCRFYLGGYIAYIKVDSRRGAAPMKDFALSVDGPLYVLLRELSRSKELPLMKKIVRDC